MAVAAGRVDEDEVDGSHPFQVFRTVGADHFGLRQPQQRQVVAGDGAELFLPFHVDGLVEAARQVGEVHAEAARKVCQQPPLGAQPRHDVGLQLCRRLAGALFHRQVRRIDQSFPRRPCGQLAARRLPAAYLVERERQVHLGIFVLKKGQPAHVVVAMLLDKVLCSHVCMPLSVDVTVDRKAPASPQTCGPARRGDGCSGSFGRRRRR